MHGHRAEDVVDRSSERLAAIQDDEHALLDVQARSTRSASNATVIVLFSVEPSHSPSGTFTPSLLTPKATTQQRPFRSIPSSINAARRMSASERDISACKCSPVLPTNARLAALLLAERSPAATSSPTGSRVRSNGGC